MERSFHKIALLFICLLLLACRSADVAPVSCDAYHVMQYRKVATDGKWVVFETPSSPADFPAPDIILESESLFIFPGKPTTPPWPYPVHYAISAGELPQDWQARAYYVHDYEDRNLPPDRDTCSLIIRTIDHETMRSFDLMELDIQKHGCAQGSDTSAFQAMGMMIKLNQRLEN
ncbi:MAG: hypothetical protein KDK30_18250 [Leptospiraceae bacterium]|nr:hypothetical protein [Leptospiraceae bacterium]